MKTGFWDGPDGKKFAGKPSDYLTMIPTLFNADTLGIRPDLVGRPVESWKDLLSPDFKGRAGLVDQATLGMMDVALAMEARGDIKYGDKGNMTKAEIDKTIRYHVGPEEERPFQVVLDQFRPVGQSDGVRRGGDPVDDLAGGDGRARSGHPVLLHANSMKAIAAGPSAWHRWHT